MFYWIYLRCIFLCVLGMLIYILFFLWKLMCFFIIGFFGERLEVVELFFGDSVMVVIELRFLIEILLKVCISGGGDVSGIEVLGVFFGVMICIGFVLLVFLWNFGGRGFGDVVVFILGRLLFVFILYKGGGM